MNFDLKLYQTTWQTISKKAIAHNINIANPIPLFVFDSIASTNTKLWEIIDRGDKCPVGAIAYEQTAGKGTWGHSWVSSAGGLYLSVGLDLDLEIADYPHLVMATAWGIATVLRAYKLPVTIKWFNDLILDRRKLGGIKIETRSNKNRLVKAVVGVGINRCNSVPKPGINLESYYLNKDVKTINSLEELTAIAAYGILLGYKYYLIVGIEKLLAEYLAILNSLGKRVEFDSSLGEVVGVTTDGKLKLKLRSQNANTEVHLSPGQISLGYE